MAKNQELTYSKLKQCLKKEIKKEFKFINAFCVEANLSKFNFSKIFNGQGMSIGTLHKSLKTLKKLPPEHNLLIGLTDLNVNILLKFYNNQEQMKELFSVLDNFKKEELKK